MIGERQKKRSERFVSPFFSCRRVHITIGTGFVSGRGGFEEIVVVGTPSCSKRASSVQRGTINFIMWKRETFSSRHMLPYV